MGQPDVYIWSALLIAMALARLAVAGRVGLFGVWGRAFWRVDPAP